MSAVQISVVVPIASNHPNLYPLVTWLSQRAAQVVVSSDHCDIDLPALDNLELVVSPRSRGGQIRAAVEKCRGSLVWVVHVDSYALDAAWLFLTETALNVDESALVWGRFDVRLPQLPTIAWFMNQRSRHTGICTGDQAMFFSRELLRAMHGFPAQPLMEDIECSRMAKRIAGNQFLAPAVAIETSAERWLKQGIVRTVLTMWWYRLQYYFGASPDHLYKQYYSS